MYVCIRDVREYVRVCELELYAERLAEMNADVPTRSWICWRAVGCVVCAGVLMVGDALNLEGRDVAVGVGGSS